ncbi:hypothetical protein FOZ62_026472, partial [Perkinsus olseni]
VGSTLARLGPRLWDKAISTQRINEACKGLKEYESRLKAEEAVNGDDDGSDRTIVNYFCGIGSHEAFSARLKLFSALNAELSWRPYKHDDEIVAFLYSLYSTCI